MTQIILIWVTSFRHPWRNDPGRYDSLGSSPLLAGPHPAHHRNLHRSRRSRENDKAARRRLCHFGWGRGITQPIPGLRPSGSRYALIQIRSRRICRTPRAALPPGFLSAAPAIKHKKPAIKAGSLCLAGGEGFEPPQTASEAVVLPLDDPPKTGLSFAVLRGLAGFMQTDLFTLDFAGVAGQEAEGAQVFA